MRVCYFVTGWLFCGIFKFLNCNMKVSQTNFNKKVELLKVKVGLYLEYSDGSKSMFTNISCDIDCIYGTYEGSVDVENKREGLAKVINALRI